MWFFQHICVCPMIVRIYSIRETKFKFKGVAGTPLLNRRTFQVLGVVSLRHFAFPLQMKNEKLFNGE